MRRESKRTSPSPHYEYQYLRAAGPDPGGRKKSFFRRHWFFSGVVGLGLIGVFIFYFTGGRLFDRAKNYLDGLAGQGVTVEVEAEPAQAAKNYWDLAVDDHLALRPLVEQLFAPETQFKMHLHSDLEAAALRKKYPDLANRHYLVRHDNTYLYVSEDGQRIYRCEIEGKILTDQPIREDQKAVREAAQSPGDGYSRDESGVVVYSPSSLSGQSLDELTKDPEMKGIFRDSDGTWRNY